MGVIQKLSENIKRGIRSWLNVMPASPTSIQINEVMDFELSAIRNRIWYRGDGNELEQMYQQNPEYTDKYKFWASKCSQGMEMRKIHTGLPGLIIRILTGIVLNDMNDFEFERPTQEQTWKEIEKQNKFRKALEKSLKEVLYIGDGAYKVTIDTALSKYPILEWYPGERIEIIKERGRLKEVVFKTPYIVQSQQYILYEYYGYGYIKNELYKGNTLVPLNTLNATKGISDVSFDKSVILAVPLQIYESTKYEGRGDRSLTVSLTVLTHSTRHGHSGWMHSEQDGLKPIFRIALYHTIRKQGRSYVPIHLTIVILHQTMTCRKRQRIRCRQTSRRSPRKLPGILLHSPGSLLAGGYLSQHSWDRCQKAGQR